MAGLIAVTHRLDLPTAALLVEQQQARVLVVDPLQQLRVLQHPLPAPEVYAHIDEAVTRRAASEAHARTVALSRVLAPLLQRVAPGADVVPWSAHRFQQLFWTALGYRYVWQQVTAELRPERWHVLLPRQPHRYGGHSFLPGLMLVEQLQARGLPHAAYVIDVPALEGGRLPDLRRLPGDVELLAHLPTCFHDAAYFEEELLASGLRCALLSAEVYDVPMEKLPASGLVDAGEVRGLLPSPAVATLDALAEPVCRLLREHLAPFIRQAAFLDTQVQSLWQGLHAQGLLSLWLDQHFEGRLPHRLLLSNHDATMHGALLSFAARHALPVSLVPHSKVFNQPVFNSDGLQLQCLHHGLQGGPCVDLGGRLLPAQRLAYPGAWQQPAAPRLATVGVVLNGLSANGISLLNVEAYAAGLRRLADGCRALGLTLRWRIRLAETPVLLLAERLGLTADDLLADTHGSLLDFGRGCDLVIGCDAPTSGLHELLREGIAVMQMEMRPLARDEWSIVDSGVAPRMNGVELLDRLRLMADNPAHFAEFCAAQHRRALDSQQGAQPLRHWLAC